MNIKQYVQNKYYKLCSLLLFYSFFASFPISPLITQFSIFVILLNVGRFKSIKKVENVYLKHIDVWFSSYAGKYIKIHILSVQIYIYIFASLLVIRHTSDTSDTVHFCSEASAHLYGKEESFQTPFKGRFMFPLNKSN